MRTRIGGVYNSDIIDFLRSLDIKDFKLDFRPRSFNFVPMSVAKDIFSHHIHSDESISLCFEDDSKETIDQIIHSIKGDLSFKEIFLEFYSSLVDFSLLDSFDLKYNLHISSSFDIKSLNKYKNLKSVIVHSKDIEQMENFNSLTHFMNQLIENLNENQKIEYQLDWDDHINALLIDRYNIRDFCFDISSKIEKSYRNIDSDLMEQLLIQNQINIGGLVENSIN